MEILFRMILFRISLSRVCLGGFCFVGFCFGGVCFGGVCLGGFCLGGFCLGGFCLGGLFRVFFSENFGGFWRILEDGISKGKKVGGRGREGGRGWSCVGCCV